MSFVCPNCGYIEYIWRPKTWHTATGDWICRMTELEEFNPDLAGELREKKEVTDGKFVYRISKTGVWVLRRWIEIWKVQGWADIPAEKARKEAKP